MRISSKLLESYFCVAEYQKKGYNFKFIRNVDQSEKMKEIRKIEKLLPPENMSK